MKKFNELALNISEEEYRNNGRFHYSDIAGYMREGFSYLMKPQKEESLSLLFGSMVDCIITEGIDKFNEKYCVERVFSISDNQKAVLTGLLETGYERLEDIPSDMIMDTLGKYYKTPKSQLSKLMEEGGEYYQFLYTNKGKTPVDYQMYQDAVDVANKLLTDPEFKSLFTGNYDGVERFFQLKFNGEYADIPITCMVDVTYVDHKQKKVWLIDLKTTCANYEWEFPKSFVKYRYDVQGKVYFDIVKQNMEKDDFYKDYELVGFMFVYISRENKTPMLWLFDEASSDEDIVFKTKNGNQVVLEDFRKVLVEMNDIKMQDLKIPPTMHRVNEITKYLNAV